MRSGQVMTQRPSRHWYRCQRHPIRHLKCGVELKSLHSITFENKIVQGLTFNKMRRAEITPGVPRCTLVECFRSSTFVPFLFRLIFNSGQISLPSTVPGGSIRQLCLRFGWHSEWTFVANEILRCSFAWACELIY